MTKHTLEGDFWRRIGRASLYGAFLALPSVGVVKRYAGGWGLLIYVAGTMAAFTLLTLYGHTGTVRLTEGLARRLLLGTLLLLTLLFAAGYPLANSGRFGGGSDRDEALDVAAATLLSGEYPYHARTYLGNPISPMPGSILLAAPFAMLGTSALQNIFWLALWALLAARFVNCTKPVLLMLWALFGLSPVLLQEWVTGGDLIANALMVLVLSVALLHVQGYDRPLTGMGILLAVLLGIGLSSRANFLLTLPLLARELLRRQRRIWGALTIAVTLLSFALVTIPFYLFDPSGFSPLQTAGEIMAFSTLWSRAGKAITVINVLLALALAPGVRGTSSYLARSAAVLGLPVWAGTALLLMAGVGNLEFTGFGIFYLIFAGMAVVKRSS